MSGKQVNWILVDFIIVEVFVENMRLKKFACLFFFLILISWLLSRAFWEHRTLLMHISPNYIMHSVSLPTKTQGDFICLMEAGDCIAEWFEKVVEGGVILKNGQ